VGCNFDVVDAVKKLEKLGIVSRVSWLQDITHKKIEQYHYQEPAKFEFLSNSLPKFIILTKMIHPGLNWKDPMCSIEAGE
jgi:hypothetical protein